MSTSTTHSQPTPERFFNAVNAYELTEAVKAAVELEVFTGIAEGNVTPAKLANRCQAAERGLRILCDFLCIHGFIAKENGQYALAPDAALFLDRRSPAYLGGTLEFMLTMHLRQAHEHLAEAVRRGGTALGAGTLEPENPDWVRFARGMTPLAYKPAELAATELRKGGEAHKVLDISASHGMYGILVAKVNPTAQIYASDWKNVLEVAQKNAEAAGVADRYHLLPGSAFETDFGADYDLILVPNFLHHFDAATSTALMRKVYAALKPGGRAAIVDFVPNADRISPPTAAAFSLMMLATTPSGDAYTFNELKKFATDAGFACVELASQVGISDLVVAYR
jgi:SAM-dependent methyltransferase